MKIRPATATDVDAMASVWLASALQGFAHIFPPEAPKPERAHLAEQLRHDLVDPCTRAFVAEVGRIVGMVVTGVWRNEPRTGRLARLYVTPSVWGRGIGTRLYERAERELRSQEFDTLRLSVLRANTRARSMYERRGWRLTNETITVYEPAGVDDVVYRLDL